MRQELPGALDALRVARYLRAEVMLRKAFLDGGLLQQARHKSLPHAGPSPRITRFFIDITFSRIGAEKKRRDVGGHSGRRIVRAFFPWQLLRFGWVTGC